jgi:hypothetical protein
MGKRNQGKKKKKKEEAPETGSKVPNPSAEDPRESNAYVRAVLQDAMLPRHAHQCGDACGGAHTWVANGRPNCRPLDVRRALDLLMGTVARMYGAACPKFRHNNCPNWLKSAMKDEPLDKLVNHLHTHLLSGPNADTANILDVIASIVEVLEPVLDNRADAVLLACHGCVRVGAHGTDISLRLGPLFDLAETTLTLVDANSGAQLLGWYASEEGMAHLRALLQVEKLKRLAAQGVLINRQAMRLYPTEATTVKSLAYWSKLLNDTITSSEDAIGTLKARGLVLSALIVRLGDNGVNVDNLYAMSKAMLDAVLPLYNSLDVTHSTPICTFIRCAKLYRMHPLALAHLTCTVWGELQQLHGQAVGDRRKDIVALCDSLVVTFNANTFGDPVTVGVPVPVPPRWYTLETMCDLLVILKCTNYDELSYPQSQFGEMGKGNDLPLHRGRFLRPELLLDQAQSAVELEAVKDLVGCVLHGVSGTRFDEESARMVLEDSEKLVNATVFCHPDEVTGIHEDIASTLCVGALNTPSVRGMFGRLLSMHLQSVLRPDDRCRNDALLRLLRARDVLSDCSRDRAIHRSVELLLSVLSAVRDCNEDQSDVGAKVLTLVLNHAKRMCPRTDENPSGGESTGTDMHCLAHMLCHVMVAFDHDEVKPREATLPTVFFTIAAAFNIMRTNGLYLAATLEGILEVAPLYVRVAREGELDSSIVLECYHFVERCKRDEIFAFVGPDMPKAVAYLGRIDESATEGDACGEQIHVALKFFALVCLVDLGTLAPSGLCNDNARKVLHALGDIMDTATDEEDEAAGVQLSEEHKELLRWWCARQLQNATDQLVKANVQQNATEQLEEATSPSNQPSVDPDGSYDIAIAVLTRFVSYSDDGIVRTFIVSVLEYVCRFLEPDGRLAIINMLIHRTVDAAVNRHPVEGNPFSDFAFITRHYVARTGRDNTGEHETVLDYLVYHTAAYLEPNKSVLEFAVDTVGTLWEGCNRSVAFAVATCLTETCLERAPMVGFRGLMDLASTAVPLCVVHLGTTEPIDDGENPPTVEGVALALGGLAVEHIGTAESLGILSSILSEIVHRFSVPDSTKKVVIAGIASSAKTRATRRTLGPMIDFMANAFVSVSVEAATANAALHALLEALSHVSRQLGCEDRIVPLIAPLATICKSGMDGNREKVVAWRKHALWPWGFTVKSCTDEISVLPICNAPGCGSYAPRRCACYGAQYCSKQCRKKDWKVHMKTCTYNAR